MPAPKKKTMPVWARILIGIAGIIAIVSGLSTVFKGFGQHEQDYGKDSIIYYHDATKDDCDKLAKALTDSKYFGQNPSGLAVLLDKTGDSFVISFVVNPDKANDPELKKEFHDLGVGIAPAVPGKLTKIRLVDPELNEKQSLDV